MVFELTGTSLVLSLGTIFALYQAICWILDRYNIGEKRREYKLMKEAEITLMREVIRQAHRQFTSSIDQDQLQHIEQVYQIYHKLGGNGIADRWMNELRSIKRQDK